MIINYGKDGLENSWQSEFPQEVECSHEGCDGMARPVLNIFEEIGAEQVVVQFHDAAGSGEEFWDRDLCAFQIYICRACLDATILYNQA